MLRPLIVHEGIGLIVMPDEPFSVISAPSGFISVSYSAERLASELAYGITTGEDQEKQAKIQNALTLLSAAHLTKEGLARVVLAFSCIEILDNNPRSANKSVAKLLRRLGISNFDWEAMCKNRNDLYHGKRLLTDSEVGQLANTALELARAIVAILISQN